MEILIKILQLLLSLSILVVFHEFGHFIAAKIFKTRVEKFYLFFNPWFSLFKFKFKGTEYGMGWLPLGGYVKISGMIDESMDKEQMKQPPKSYEFRSKPAWQRLIIMVGGVAVNIILAFAIFIGLSWANGNTYLPTEQVNNNFGVVTDSLGHSMGFEDGDKIISVDGKQINEFSQIIGTIVLNQAKTVTVKRDGKDVNVPITDKDLAALIDSKSLTLFQPAFPFIVDSVMSKSLAQEIGLKKNDHVIGINDKSIPYFTDFGGEFIKDKGEKVNLKIIRNNDTLSLPVTVPETGKLGVYPKYDYFKLSHRDYTFAQAIPAGIDRTYKEINGYLKNLKLLFNPEVGAYKHVGGFISIGNIFPAAWDWVRFWTLTAILSIMLAVINILPIPALDGGHVAFLLYEVIARRKPSERFMEYAQMVGMIILFALMIFANGNDIIKLFN
ncbi:MAG: RIP metalloprotease RseP [Hyphomicrobiales bacterium]